MLQDLQNGMNILHLCCSQGYTTHVVELINVASNQYIIKDFLDSVTIVSSPEGNLENPSKQTCTALFFAIKSGHGGFLEIIQLLVKNGCNVNFVDENGMTPLHYASQLGQDDTLEILLNAKANPDI